MNYRMRYLTQENIGLISRNMDQIEEWAPDVTIQELYAQVMRQTTLTSLKELFGLICIFGTVFLILILTQRLWRKRANLILGHAHRLLRSLIQSSNHLLTNRT